MNRTHVFAAVLLIIALAVMAVGAPLIQPGDDYDLTWHTIDGGGGTSVGGSPGSEFTLSGTIGQPDSGTMSGDGFELAGGFWAGGDSTTTPTCVGDLNNSSAVDVQDLLILLSAWGPCGEPPESCPADLNDSGAVDVQDLLILLSAWGPCP